MSILNPDHLFDQADKLILAPPAGPPRQVDLRRAVSAAYYAIFHFTMISLADEFVGAVHRSTRRYTLIYRSVDHRALKDVCNEARKSTPSPKFAAYLPQNGFGADIQTFATAVADLQRRRHEADYDPSSRFRTSDAKFAVRIGRDAVEGFGRAGADRRKAFMTLLLCPPRG